MNRFQFVAGHQRRYGVKRLCTTLGITRSSFSYWRGTAAVRAARQVADAQLAARIRTVHRASDGTYGVPRITVELRENGEVVNHKRGARVMKTIGPASSSMPCIRPNGPAAASPASFSTAITGPSAAVRPSPTRVKSRRWRSGPGHGQCRVAEAVPTRWSTGWSARWHRRDRPVAVPRHDRPLPVPSAETWRLGREPYPARGKCLPPGPTEPLSKVHRPSSEGTFAFPASNRSHAR